ncbi:hypothetical protein HY932_01515 [Candidatus Falkowbacteria bacterium]|nr:hypothetical protein [Candidatus Falkowbacteria bacterium]
MYYPEQQNRPTESKSAIKFLVIAYLLLVVCFFLWSWPIFGLPAEIIIMVLCVFSLQSFQRRWAIVCLLINCIFLLLTLINIGVRVYLAYS